MPVLPPSATKNVSRRCLMSPGEKIAPSKKPLVSSELLELYSGLLLAPAVVFFFQINMVFKNSTLDFMLGCLRCLPTKLHKDVFAAVLVWT